MASLAPKEDPIGKKAAKPPIQSANPEATIAHQDAKLAKQDSKLARCDPGFTLALSPLKRTWSMPMATSRYDLLVAFLEKYEMDEFLV